MMSTSEDVNNNSFCRTSCYVIRFRWEYFSTRWWQSNNVHDWRLSVAMKQLCWVWCGNVCEDHSSGLRTLVLIPVLAEWFQTRPLRGALAPQAWYYGQLVGRNPNPGLRRLSDTELWTLRGSCSRFCVKTCSRAEVKLPAALAKWCRAQALLGVPDSCLRVRVDLAPP